MLNRKASAYLSLLLIALLHSASVHANGPSPLFMFSAMWLFAMPFVLAFHLAKSSRPLLTYKLPLAAVSLVSLFSAFAAADYIADYWVFLISLVPLAVWGVLQAIWRGHVKN